MSKCAPLTFEFAGGPLSIEKLAWARGHFHLSYYKILAVERISPQVYGTDV